MNRFYWRITLILVAILAIPMWAISGAWHGLGLFAKHFGELWRKV